MRYKETSYVSVRLMTFNHSPYIRSAMEGILQQKTKFPVEVVVGDDFSQDNTLEIIREFKNTSKITIKILARKEGDEYWVKRQKYGRIYNFVNILENCSGKFIALLDGDDYWTDPYKLQKQVDFLEKNQNFVLSFHDADVVDESGILLGKGRLKNNKSVRTSEELITGAHIPTLTVMFRNIIREYPKETMNVMNGDAFLFALLGHYGKAYRHFDIKNACYRKHDSNMWAGKSKFFKFKQQNKTFKAILKISDKTFKKRLLRKILSQNYNLIKHAPTIKDRLRYLVSFVKYGIKYKLASKN